MKPAAPTVSQKPKFLKFTGSTLYSNNFEETEKLCSKMLELENLQEIGFDMEWKVSYEKYKPQNKTALIQLCYEAKEKEEEEIYKVTCLCIHIFFSGVTPSLKKILVSEKIKKVGVNILNDASKFQRDFGIEMAGLVELMNEAKSRILDEGATIAYTGKTDMQTLTDKVLGASIEKENSPRISNWEQRNLSQQQIYYAALDAYASLLIYQKIIQFKKPAKQIQSQEQNSKQNNDKTNSIENSNEKNKQDSNDGSSSAKNQSNVTVENQDPNLQTSDGKQNKNINKLLNKDQLVDNSLDVNLLAYKNFNEWEKRCKNVLNLTPAKRQTYDLFMIDGKSFQEISEIKKIKISTVQQYFCDAIKSGYHYKFSALNVPHEVSEKLLQRIKILYPELAEIIHEIDQFVAKKLQESQEKEGIFEQEGIFQETQQMEVDETENKENQSLKAKIQNLFGQLDCRDFSNIFKDKKSFGLKVTFSLKVIRSTRKSCNPNR
eukprot:TRINITY_DN7664_c2_g1_i2.p1 TRINITY_DN7664_c2_g1~~TRINITY_DN7664_c2_g1_i2.p1  ORF type:complete len:542 (-),score=64.42 TRINITY_DN7664_c2_g1_i2:40-1509(-)